MARKHTILIKLILKLSKCIIRSGCSSSLVFTRRQFRKPLIRDSFRKQESLTSLVGDSEKENNILGDKYQSNVNNKNISSRGVFRIVSDMELFRKNS